MQQGKAFRGQEALRVRRFGEQRDRAVRPDGGEQRRGFPAEAQDARVGNAAAGTGVRQLLRGDGEQDVAEGAADPAVGQFLCFEADAQVVPVRELHAAFSELVGKLSGHVRIARIALRRVLQQAQAEFFGEVRGEEQTVLGQDLLPETVLRGGHVGKELGEGCGGILRERRTVSGIHRRWAAAFGDRRSAGGFRRRQDAGALRGRQQAGTLRRRQQAPQGQGGGKALCPIRRGGSVRPRERRFPIGGSFPPDGDGADGAAASGQAQAVFQPQDVVGGGEKVLSGKRAVLWPDCPQRGGPGPGEGPALLQTPLQGGLKGRRFRAQQGSGAQKGGDIPAFAAEAERVRHAQTVHQRDGPCGEIPGAAAGKEDGQLQHQICAAEQRHPRPGIFVRDRALAPLDEIAAHHRHDIVGAGEAAGALQVKLMPVVERIVFCDDGGCFHMRLPFPIVAVGFIIAAKGPAGNRAGPNSRKDFADFRGDAALTKN